MESSYIQVYTGNGKGKTTAVLGLSLRALGAGKSVYIGQFLKNGDYSEVRMLRKMTGLLEEGQRLVLEQFGEPRFIRQEPRPEDREAARKGWEALQAAARSGLYDLVIMEEINVALHLKLLPLEEVSAFLEARPAGVELILSGRYAPEEIIQKADLVSRIEELKHYYKQGVAARVGIEK